MPVDLPKLKQVVQIIAAHPAVHDLGKTKLNKLIYYADVFCLRETGKTITGSEYIKYPHGPVPSRMDRAMRHMKRDGHIEVTSEDMGNDYVRHRVKPTETPITPTLTPDELHALNMACEQYGEMSATDLSNLSHLEPAYISVPLMDKLSASLMPYGPKVDPEGL